MSYHERACYLHGLDIVRAYAPHLLNQVKQRPKPAPVAPVVAVDDPPPQPVPEQPLECVTEGLYAPTYVKQAVAEICRRWGCTWADVVGPSRLHKLHSPRMEIYVFLYESGWSLCQIGRLCDRDHTTILHWVKKVRS